ncbi:MAG: hypothetical protein NTV06_04380, partial [candidate division Zixibacteria bacterium]|nr:hypothetical protein [candidate division Zixibacteria bacterium]
MKRRKLLTVVLPVSIFLIIFLSNISYSRALYDIPETDYRAGKVMASSTPYEEVAVHHVSKIGLMVSNKGNFGYGFNKQADPFFDEAPSCTYPFPGGGDYLFAAAFWIGAVVGRDTLVSVGADGWYSTEEMWPDVDPFGAIQRRSTIRGDDAAISEEDFIAVYADTLCSSSSPASNAGLVVQDPRDGRPHIPLGIEVTERSFAWSYAYAEDFVLFDYSIKNIGKKKLNKVYMGIYVDADVKVTRNAGEGFDDDICGFRRDIPSIQECGFIDTVNIAWIADNDGRQ